MLQPVALEDCQPPRTTGPMRCGTAVVYENPEGRDRQIELAVIVIPARSSAPRPDPVFFIAGGPGQTATDLAAMLERTPYPDERDVVLVDQRGTSGAQRLDCPTLAAADDPQAALAPMFSAAELEPCRRDLAARADLTRYTTLHAVEDLDAVRRAMGYRAINLVAISYGTRVALMYARRHPSQVRTAILSGLAPPALRNPLYHAREAQTALDSLLSDCLADAACRGAFPRLRAELDSVVARLRRKPATVIVARAERGDSVAVEFGANQFAEATRLLMYTPADGRWLPLLIHRGSTGDFRQLVQAAVNANRRSREGLRRGMLMSVVCSEDIPRISESEIDVETRGTLLGDVRVRQQVEACGEWPRGDVPAEYGERFIVPVPALLVSGSRDPVTPARWGDEMRRYFPESVHLTVAGGHGVHTACVMQVAIQLLRQATVAGLDASCTIAERYGDFVLR